MVLRGAGGVDQDKEHKGVVVWDLNNRGILRQISNKCSINANFSSSGWIIIVCKIMTSICLVCLQNYAK